MPTCISTADTATLIRAAMGEAFPDRTFGVRARLFAGGVSVDITWADDAVPDIDGVTRPKSGVALPPARHCGGDGHRSDQRACGRLRLVWL